MLASFLGYVIVRAVLYITDWLALGAIFLAVLAIGWLLSPKGE